MNKAADSQTRAMRREYKRFIGDAKYDYYMKKFDEMDRKNSTISFNLSAFFFSNIWCFHRRLLIPGFVVLLLHFAAIILSTRVSFFTTPTVQLLLTVICLMPNVYFGLFGNNLYRNYVQTCADKATHLISLQRESFYKENADVSYRTSIMIGIVYAIIIVLFAVNLAQ